MEHKKDVLKKPTTCRKPPVVKQTRTSMYRVIKANPLLLKNNECNNFGLKSIKLPENLTLPSTVTMGYPKILQNDHVFSELSKNTLQTTSNVPNELGPSGANSERDGKKTGTVVKTRNVVAPRHLSRETESKSRIGAEFHQPMGKEQLFGKMGKKYGDTGRQSLAPLKKQTNSNSIIATGRIRRSISEERFDRLKIIQGTTVKHGTVSNQTIRSTSSLSELQQFEGNIPQTQRKRTVTFKSPFRTPSTVTKSCIYSSTPGPQLSQLQDRLNQWLHKRGKSLKSFHKLKSFDKPMENAGTGDLLSEDKENIAIEVNCINNKSVDKTLVDEDRAEVDTKHDDSGLKPLTDFESIVKEALKDLLKLVNDGYPIDQCEAWLEKIQYDYNSVRQTPEYWECRAAMEQNKGQFSSAVDCYTKAIINGAKVQNVDESLEQLFEKFSLLNIKPNDNNDSKHTKVLIDARTVFKSTIVKFAISKKGQNKKDKRKSCTVTPVRRSARISKVNTPINESPTYFSIKEIDNNDEMNFKTNSCLGVRYGHEV